MVEPQFNGVEHLTGQGHGKAAAAAVEGIPHNGMPPVAAMDTNLMGAARPQLEARQGVIPQPFQYLPMGTGLAPVLLPHNGIPAPVHG